MASLAEILVALQNGVEAINRLPTRLLGEDAGSLLSFYGFNSITSSPTTVVAGSTGTSYPTQLSFHNPSAISVWVYPTVDGNGNAITIVSTSAGGGILLYGNGGTVEINGGSTVPWAAISTGTASLTVSRNE